MSIHAAYAAVAVHDLAAAKDFYARLLGRHADLEPMPSLAQWDVGPTGGLQVVELPDQAGTSMATLMLDDLDATLEALAARGITVGEVVTGRLSRLTSLTDPSGNTITLAEVPPA